MKEIDRIFCVSRKLQVKAIERERERGFFCEGARLPATAQALDLKNGNRVQATSCKCDFFVRFPRERGPVLSDFSNLVNRRKENPKLIVSQ